MTRMILTIAAAVTLLLAGIVLADTLGLAPAAFGCAAGDTSDARYCN